MTFHRLTASCMFLVAASFAAACKSPPKIQDPALKQPEAQQKPGQPAPVAATPVPAKVEPPKPGEILNRVRYVVGDESITEMDLEQMRKNLLRMGRPVRNLQEDAVKELIRRAIVENEARTESVIVSDQKIENEVNRAKENVGIKDETRFRQALEAETGMPYALWVENLRYDLMKQQLIQIKISVPPPSADEMKRFYYQNAAKSGLEVRYREIILQPRNTSIEEESRISNLARQIGERSRGNAQAFGELARTTPDNVSPLKLYGGLADYTSLAEVASTDRVSAGILSGMMPGQTSIPFRDARGRYVVFYMEDRRPVSYEKLEDRIRQKLFYEKAEQAFEEWIEKKKKEIAITEIN